MKSKITCGVAGVGYLGQHHARIYADIEECKLVGIYDINFDRAKEISERYNCEVFESIDELGKNCECISIVTPTDNHAETAIKLIAHDCHLLIEKPLTSTKIEAEKILDASRNHDKILQVGLIEHYNPVMNFLENAVDCPRFISAQRLAPYINRGTEVGVILDLMIHDIGIILQLVKSELTAVEAIGINVLSSSEDIANARLKFQNGCVADLNVSRVSEKKLREIRIFQEQMYISMDFTSQSGHIMKLEKDGLQRTEIPIEKEEPLKTEILSFINCVKHHNHPKIDIHFGKKTLELALHITNLAHIPSQ